MHEGKVHQAQLGEIVALRAKARKCHEEAVQEAKCCCADADTLASRVVAELKAGSSVEGGMFFAYLDPKGNLVISRKE